MYPNIKALLIDIDDTITGFKKDCARPDRNLMQVLETAGVELGGLAPAESARRVTSVRETLRWWVWEDFIDELGLDHDRFWNFAYDIEREYFEAAGPEIRSVLRQLHGSGMPLYITSNNPTSGIRHKLRLAGFTRSEIAAWFHALFGVSEIEAMKWEERYWKKVVALSGFPAAHLATVGDNLRDDYELPATAGIGHAFIINRKGIFPESGGPHLTFVKSFQEIAAHLGHPGGGATQSRPAHGRTVGRKPSASNP